MDKIICVGKNYLEHAKELGDAIPEKPVLFIKPPSVLRAITDPSSICPLPLPEHRGAVHHECEIVLQVGKNSQIAAVSLGLDMTLRDLQRQQKESGHPWTTSKVFPGSAIVGPFLETADFPDWEKEPFEFYLNGILRQKGAAPQMTLTVHEMIPYVETYFPVCEGDLIFTGTPSGVGAVNKNDVARLSWGPLKFQVKWT